MKSKIRFYNLTPKMKSNLRDGAILTTAIAGGYGIFGIFGSKLFTRDEIEAVAELPTEEQYEVITDSFEMSGESCVEVEVDTEVVEVVGEQSFAEAFSEARAELGAGGFFNYRGQTYSTFYNEEFEAKDSEEQEAYASELDDKIDTDSAQELDASEELGGGLEHAGDDDIVIDNGGSADDLSSDDTDVIIGNNGDESNRTNDITQATANDDEIEITETVDNDYDVEVTEELDLTVVADQTNTSSDIESLSSVDINATLAPEESVSGEASGIEISYEEFNDADFGDATLQAESSDDTGFGNQDNYDVADFNDSAFDGAETLESSNTASDLGFAIVEEGDFNDPLFDSEASFTAESSNDEGNVGFADVDASDFNDPLFGDPIPSNTGDVAIVDVTEDILIPIEGEDIVTNEDELSDLTADDIELEITEEIDLFDTDEEDFITGDLEDLD